MMKTDPRSGGFTLLEILIASAISCAAFAAFITSCVLLQKSFMANYNFAESVNNVQRLMDYITRDVHRASGASAPVVDGRQTLNLVVPDCYSSYDESGNPSGLLVTGSVSGGKYVEATKMPVGIVYCRDKDDPTAIVRQQTINGVTSSQTVAKGISGFTINYSASDPQIVNFTVSFAPKFSSNSNAQTSFSASASIRYVQ